MKAAALGLVDCHCHLSAPDFDHDLDDVLEKAKEANVVALVAVAEHSGEFEKIMKLSERYSGFILLCLGVHPIQGLPEDQRSVTLKDLDDALPIIEKYKDQLLAIGEVGLDFSPRFANTDEKKEEQRQVLIRQVQLAKRLNLPLNVHSRSAGRPTINLLNEQDKLGFIEIQEFDQDKPSESRFYAADHGAIVNQLCQLKKSKERNYFKALFKDDYIFNCEEITSPHLNHSVAV
ncbi:PREDICTED: putative deoxyribonuclease TATDN3-like [Elephantulus edwardii]|uniref:putative deoxyribonuclease TATDN3-like n=1 Tax=Elephantulus edwardii TaxID=28737 RepID=UPI0003F0BCA9|nr:PREDICTED: putative deoxyribonuclease TATDN3-like [Elephantulus edwardii]